MKKQLKNWLDAWQKKDYNGMYEYTQNHWKRQVMVSNGKIQDNKLYLKNLYKNTELLEYEILDTKPAEYDNKELDTSVIMDVRVKCKVFYKQIPICKDEIRLIRMLQENSIGDPVKKAGTWGVNPQSALRKL